MRRTTFIIIVVLIILAGVYVAFVYQGSPTSFVSLDQPIVSTSTSATSTASSTLNWTPYNSAQYNYSLLYPANFTLQIASDKVTLIVPIKNYFNTILPGDVHIDIANPTTACPPILGDQVTSTSTFTSPTGLVFNESDWSGVGAGQLYVGKDYVITHNNLCYDIQVYTHSANGAGFYFSDPTMIANTDTQQGKDMVAFFVLAQQFVGTFQFNN